MREQLAGMIRRHGDARISMVVKVLGYGESLEGYTDPQEIADQILALLREEYQPFLEKVKAQPYTNQDLMRQHGYVIDNLEDKWQKLVCTLHTNDAALSVEAEQLLEELQEGL